MCNYMKSKFKTKHRKINVKRRLIYQRAKKIYTIDVCRKLIVFNSEFVFKFKLLILKRG